MSDHDARERFGLYRLCECPMCEGSGKAFRIILDVTEKLTEDLKEMSGRKDLVVELDKDDPRWNARCPECRGEGRIRQEVASCATAEAVGVALVTCAREGEWAECAFGLLDRTPECPECGGAGRGPSQGHIPRDERGPFPDAPWFRCPVCKGTGHKPTGDWLVLPWLPSARNLRDAARTLARSKKRAGSS